MKDLEYLLPELKEHYDNCNELFDIAWELDKSDYTRTAFSQIVTSYMTNILQTLSHIIGEIKENDEGSKHGEWSLESDEDMPDPMFKLLVCSVCNLKANSPYKYCPNCGTKMTSHLKRGK